VDFDGRDRRSSSRTVPGKVDCGVCEIRLPSSSSSSSEEKAGSAGLYLAETVRPSKSRCGRLACSPVGNHNEDSDVALIANAIVVGEKAAVETVRAFGTGQVFGAGAMDHSGNKRPWVVASCSQPPAKIGTVGEVNHDGGYGQEDEGAHRLHSLISLGQGFALPWRNCDRNARLRTSRALRSGSRRTSHSVGRRLSYDLLKSGRRDRFEDRPTTFDLPPHPLIPRLRDARFF
jgi:hypothetical protein